MTLIQFAFERFSPRCLVKPTLLILSVLRFAETRSLLTSSLESAGHKLVHAASCEQSQILLSNGLDPDLVIVESSPAARFSDLFDTVQAASRSVVCLVHGPGDEQIKNQAAALGISLFLERRIVGAAV